MKLMMVLVMLLAAAMLFPAGQADRTVAPVEVSAPGVFPIVDQPISLTFFAPQHAIVENMATNNMTRYMEELTNIRIQWETTPQQAVNEKRTLLLASGDYPDVLFSAGVTRDEEMIYGSQGVFLPLNDYIGEQAVEFARVMDERPLTRQMITTPDGNIYAMPHINECDHCVFGQKMWINREWLAELGLTMPTTTDEMHAALLAFKTMDPNGNGLADEIPFSGHAQSAYTRLPAFFMNAFVYYDATSYFHMENDQVSFVANKPEWRDGLRYLRRLYVDGLIDPATFTQDGTQLTTLGENPDDVILGSSIGLWYGVFTRNGAPSNRFTLYDAVPPLTGPAGYRTTGYYPYQIISGNFVITNKNRYPEASFRWVDHLYSQEATLRTNFGRENEEWRWATPDEVGINGLPAIWVRLSTFGSLQNYHWAQMGPSYRPDYLRLGEKGVPPEELFTGSGLATRLYNETSEKYDVGIVPAQVYPPVYMTRAQASETAQLRTAIDGYVQESTARFIIGELDIERQWDAYVRELENIGIRRYVEISQEAYEAQYRQ